ncbi:hypothetical protein ACHAXA_003882 [Cyclostephanos tholiformis]|uniref:DUF305 domain-containing protein n=1 Tax=Cyclostephanos tholiformis TaxID=382380 RepID=A0ABD3RA39_9STRA
MSSKFPSAIHLASSLVLVALSSAVVSGEETRDLEGHWGPDDWPHIPSGWWSPKREADSSGKSGKGSKSNGSRSASTEGLGQLWHEPWGPRAWNRPKPDLSGKSAKGSKGSKNSTRSNRSTRSKRSTRSRRSRSSKASERPSSDGGKWVLAWAPPNDDAWGWSEPEPDPEPSGKSGKSGGSKSGKSGGNADDDGSVYEEEWGGSYNHDPELCHAKCEGDLCTYTSKVAYYASEFGAFYFEECPESGNYPKLAMEIGKTYRFVQAHVTNWFHPLGFAYGQDGALAGAPELEEEYLSYQKNGEDVTLDGYEPEFAWPIEEWVSNGVYYVEVTLPIDFRYKEDLFYFCHIHQYFGARIKLMKNGKIINPLPLPEHKLVPPPPSEYDQHCGTYGLIAETAGPGIIGDGWSHSMLGDFRLPHPECPSEFICEEDKSTFATCTDAINCHMFNGMTTNENYSEVALFLHQMIPHHQQAVNQAKSLLLYGGFSCPQENLGSDDYDCVFENLLRSIINAQNAQVQAFRELLESYTFPEFDQCDLKKSGAESSNQASPYDFEDITRYSGWAGDRDNGSTRFLEEDKNLHEEVVKGGRGLVDDGICRGDCYTAKDGKEVCIFTVKLAIFESDLGAWYFEECGKDNLYPVIGVEIGASTVFVQEDITNWYHPLGFAYFVDGAHVDKPEVEEEYLTYRLDAEDIGLDGYEPLFLHSPTEWIEYGTFSVELNFPKDYDQDLFYFCHVHYSMSGRIKLLKNGTPVNKADSPVIPYSHPPPSEYDRSCGTYGLSPFQLPNTECPKTFVCDKQSKFAECLNTMNCYMMVGMTTYSSEGDNALFLHQMIPHHINAVNMAKALFKADVLNCPDLLKNTDDCKLSTILWDIIGNQNLQIQTMYQLLAEQGDKKKNDCVIDFHRGTQIR